MEFEPLTKPRSEVHFRFWRLLFHFNWAKDWIWAYDTGDIRRTELAAICLVQKHSESGKLNALSLTLGPLKVMVGLGV